MEATTLDGPEPDREKDQETKNTRQTPPENGDLADDLAGHLNEEINMLRRVMRRTLRTVEGNSSSGVRDWVSLLNALSSAAARLTTLLKTQHELNQADVDGVAAALKTALEELGYDEGC
jgi:hypothetical protein